MMDIIEVPRCRNKWVMSGDSGVVKPNRIKPILGAVIHHTATFSDQSCINWFTSPQNKDSSAHYLVGLTGKVWQFVREDERAWHAGRSSLEINGTVYSSWNEFSLGYELTGNGNLKPYTDAQYESLGWLLAQAALKFNISKEFVVGHQQICPLRKTDPGPLFDWTSLFPATLR